MGFRPGAYMTIWEVKPIKDTVTEARVSCSRKNKMTNEYEEDFSGFVRFCGTATAGKALSLQPRDRIKVGDTDVRRRYDKEKKVEYTDFLIWSFELLNNSESVGNGDPTADLDRIFDDPIPSGLPF